MKIFKKKRTYKVHDLEITLNKLNLEQQKQLTVKIYEAQSGVVDAVFDAGVFALKHCIDDITGLVDEDGDEYKLEKAKDGYLTDECVEILMTLPINDQLMSLTFQTVSQTPDHITDKDGKKIKEIKLKN